MEKIIRYTKQRRSHDCVPTAFINILKWAGQKFSYNYAYDSFKSLLDCKTGTKSDKELAMMRVLNLAGFPIDVFHNKLNLSDIDASIKKGRILAVSSFVWFDSEPGLHTFLVIGSDSKHIHTVNALGGKVKNCFLRKDFKTLFLKRLGNYPNAFAIGKPKL